jgi:hypothetical protein
MTMIPRHSKEEDYSPEEAQRELMELVIKAGRRCAYDLKHAANAMPLNDDMFGHKFYHQRADMWLKVFDPVDMGKNYKHELHHVIYAQDYVIEKYRELVKKHGIENEANFDEQLPF